MEKSLSEAEKSLFEEKRIQEDDLRSYQRMVGGFLRAFKSETKRILQSQRSDLDFSKLEKMTPTYLAKVAKEEVDAKKSACEQRKRLKEKKTNKKPPSESPIVPSLLPEESSAEAPTEAEDSTIVLDDPVDVIDIVALKSGTDV